MLHLLKKISQQLDLKISMLQKIINKCHSLGEACSPLDFVTCWKLTE